MTGPRRGTSPAQAESAARSYLSLRGATFLGVGSMVGAGIFALLGEAGAVAGSATWLSFLLAGLLTLTMGYTVAKLGARYPSSGGIIAYLEAAFGKGHAVGIAAWLGYFTFVSMIAMVAVSFGEYASSLLFDSNDAATACSIALIVAAGVLNVRGATLLDVVQSSIVIGVLGVFAVFVVAALPELDANNLDPAGYPGLRSVLASIALTFFAYLGFAIITFSAGDLREPSRQLPIATYAAIAIATTVYVAVSLAVFGSLTVDEVVDAGSTAIAEAARPSLGDAGYTMISVAAMLATASSTIATTYGTYQLTRSLGRGGEFPAWFAADTRRGHPVGLVLTVLAALVLVSFFDLTAIASVGTAIALTLFVVLGFAGVKLREQTGASVWIMAASIACVMAILAIFAVDTARNEPVTLASMALLLAASVALELGWTSRQRTRRVTPDEPAGA